MKKKTSFFHHVKNVWPFIKESKGNLVAYAFVSIIEAILGAIIPLVEAKIILNITDGIMSQLILTALAVLSIEFVLYIMFYFKNIFYNKVYQKTLTSLQVAVARETLKLEMKEIDKATSGLFIDRLNKDTQDISGLFMEYAYWTSYVISNLGVLVAIFVLDHYLFFYCLFASVLIFFVNKKRLSKQYEVQKNVKKIREKKTSLTGEVVRGMKDIKVLNASQTILKQMNDRIIEDSKEELKMIRIRSFYSYITSNLRAISDFGFLLLGSYLYSKGLLSIPTFVIVYNYQPKIKSLLNGVVQILEYNKRFIVSSERIFEIIENNTFEKEIFGTKHITKLSGKIEFKNVQFGYTEQPIIKKMNFVIHPNEKVAFVGKSGAGKSTIFSLITRLYHTNTGEILLDDCNINSLDGDSIRNNMSIITQNPYIFNFSIKENLLLAKADASMEEIRNACQMACLDDFILSLPEQYETIVGENGVILSGGQKQRLAIARALLMKTEIILFDEATSALDNETQQEIQEAIANLKGEYTILIVAHRLSTVVDSDRIFVVEDGKIVDSGSHKELIQKCDFYKKLYEKDLNA